MMMPADGSPSRDRLSRIAAMIRHAEQAVPVGGDRPRRDDDARLIPLFPRGKRARLRAGGAHAVVVELAG
jgi:hypothetical protein